MGKSTKKAVVNVPATNPATVDVAMPSTEACPETLSAANDKSYTSKLQAALRAIYAPLREVKNAAPTALLVALGVSGGLLAVAMAPSVAALATSLGVTAQLLAAAGFVKQALTCLVALTQTLLFMAQSLIPYICKFVTHPVLLQTAGAAVVGLVTCLSAMLAIPAAKATVNFVKNTAVPGVKGLVQSFTKSSDETKAASAEGAAPADCCGDKTAEAEKATAPACK